MSKFIEAVIKMNQPPTLDELQEIRSLIERDLDRLKLGLYHGVKTHAKLNKEWDDINILIDERVNMKHYPIQYY